jgi:hypothetical protein
MRALGVSDLLALWERGAARHALDRSTLLAAFARPDLPPEAITEMPLGEITASLLRLREASFGARIRSHVDCEHCGQRLELTLNACELLQPISHDESTAPVVDVAGLRVRTPTLRDLAAVTSEPDAGRAARQLLERCTTEGDAAALSDAAFREIEDALEAADPNADLAFDVRCEACGHLGTAQLDAGELLWDEINARARALLGEVHLLARAYGWTESEILALSAVRRAFYLSMVAT